ncbi:hypothetical protein NDR87_28645 [Nocardia sp. CDC159]|uniref:Phthiocerol/phthiodiolone dimycocerosyl transferase n=1 Tax=Nocardia pulmonis TaxID=2951408 RepID=A0A9X2EBV5_9NOCA|nr:MULTISPECIES: hypothetical protein [Nocardia]MCM6777544.1 hypothetical protein [Nocardia pulmonis]MCM6790349.1 hypothetical protein [Nocardia sp. CDC159]
MTLCVGEVDTALLHRAFELLCRKFPILRGTIELTGGGAELHIPDDSSSAATVDIAAGPIAGRLGRDVAPLDPARTLAELTTVSEGATTAVALRISHAINDATLGFALLAHFWHAAAALAGTVEYPDPTPVYPLSLEHAYLARAMDLPAPAVPTGGPVRGLAVDDVGAGTGFGPDLAQRITLSQADTAALLGRARAAGTTLHALLAAAIVRAERATITESTDAATELPMIMFHLADLRPHLCPAARPDEVTNALAFAPTITVCEHGTDLGVLAKQVKTQIVDGIEGGTALAVMLAAASAAAHGRARETVGNFITNWGVVPDLPVPAGLEIVDFRGFATSEPVSWVGYFVSTFAGRCSIELAFSSRFHPPAQIAELRELIVANLAQLNHPPLP